MTTGYSPDGVDNIVLEALAARGDDQPARFAFFRWLPSVIRERANEPSSAAGRAAEDYADGCGKSDGRVTDDSASCIENSLENTRLRHILRSSNQT